jgi:hypothetical protein
MAWARVALVVGLLLLFAAFAHGTESHKSVSIADQRYDCGAAISPSWLVSGTPDVTLQAQGQGPEHEGLAATACGHVIRESRIAMLTVMGAAALLALIGWGVLRERGEPQPPQMSRSIGTDRSSKV